MKTIKISALLSLSLLTACGGGDSSGPASDESSNNNPETATGGSGTNTNTTAIAVAGATMEVIRNTPFLLNGSGSSDADGDTLTYTWTQTLGPDVTSGVGFLSGEFPSITAPFDVSTLRFELVVNDGQADSAPDAIQINVMEQPGEAVFVDGTVGVGSDATGDGSRSFPYASVLHALSNLPAASYDIYVRTISGQRYVEGRDAAAPAAVSWAVPDGTSLYGGFGRDWVRDVDANRTSVWLASRGIHFENVNQDTWFSGFELLAQNPMHWVHPESFGISADTGTATLYIQDNTINSGDVTAASASSYGLRLSNIAAVRILRNVIVSGTGGDGEVGDAGLNGNAGRNGSTSNSQSGAAGGHYGSCAWGSNADGNCTALPRIVTGGGSSSASISGGNGGRGGNQGGQNGGRGGDGFRDGDPFNDPSGASGGAGGDFGHQDGHNGSGGFGGFHRSQAGAGGNGHGSISGGVFVNTSASNGARGGHGGGGGGGGGSEGNLGSDGGGGGGGGGGGVGGQGGMAGGSGGASIGILVSDIPDVLIEGNTVISANGGGGAVGGNGGEGGNGGSGGHGEVSGDQGGRGGGGGHGGQGGQGGIGGGGPSYSILVGANMAPEIVQNRLQAGSGGASGSNSGATGGRWGNVGNGSGSGATGYHSTARASSGSLADGGWSYTIYDINPGDGLVPFVSSNNTTPGAAGARGQAGEQNF